MSLEREVGTGLAWGGASKGVTQLVGLVVTLVLARRLRPEDFGLLAMIAVVTGFFGVFRSMGFASALIQRPEIDERHRSSVFWLNLFTGILLAALLVLAGPALAGFYREPLLVWIARVLAVDFLLAPLYMVQHAILSRELQFRPLALAETWGVLLSSAAAIGLAFLGYGVWALVLQTLAATVVEIVVVWMLSPWRPRLIFDRAALRDLWSFSANLLGYSSISYWATQVDDLLIGRVLGARPLGLYGRAYSTVMMPVTEAGGVLSRVMFPTFSKLQNDPQRFRELYLRIVATLSFLVFPVMFALGVLAEPVISVVYGSQWLGSASVLRIYCLVGASQVIGSTTIWIYQACGRTDWLVRWGFFAAALTIAGICAGAVFRSIESVALGYAIVTVFVLAYPRFAIPARLIGLRMRDLLGAVIGPLGAALLMASALLGIGFVLSSRVSSGVDLAVRALVGIVLYMFLARLLRLRGLDELRRAIRSRITQIQEP